MSRPGQTAGRQMIRVGPSHSTPDVNRTFVFFACFALFAVRIRGQSGMPAERP
jgi:hypothetical protein